MGTPLALPFWAFVLAVVLLAVAGTAVDAAARGKRSDGPDVSKPTTADHRRPRKAARGKAIGGKVRTTIQAIPVSPSVMQPLPEIPPPRFPAPLPPPPRESRPALVTPGVPTYSPNILTPGPGGSLTCTPISRQQGLC
jgi:hypothetical protein